ncbi:Tad domain-containing protein [Altererythrobacter sp. KTW20L]|nr:Tad domain-containing protein [Altererythrobacter sp. KTW20L]
MTVVPSIPGFPKQDAAQGCLRRLASNEAGNVIIIAAASLFPLLALIGSGIDMGRGYLAETRLQQACDAGTLAARKRLGTSVAVNGVIPDTVADTGQRFFNINFRDGSHGSVARNFVMTLENDLSISGVATAQVPTTIMGAFGFDMLQVSASCSAQITMANTDIMMVLDTTGSMLWTNPDDTEPRIAALRSTVKSFHAQMEGNKPPGTRIRYGFLPYSTNVNVGHLLRDEWLVDEWEYNYRVRQNNIQWRYSRMTLDLAFLGTANTVQVPMGGSPSAPTNVTARYRGCVEERDTYEITDYGNVDLSRALDLDLDRVPNPNDPATQWRPMLNELSYVREIRTNGWGGFSRPQIITGTEFVNANSWGYSACPSPAHQLAEMTAEQVATYVDGMVVQGSTYHDIGMIWGGRLLSPTGLFAAQNADQPGRVTTRHMIYLTDGETAPLDVSYGSYGIEPLDQRRWSPTSIMSLTQTVENRFSFACAEVKKRNIQVWVISFGTGANPVMQTCAGQERYFVADDAASLEATFSTIARRMGELRIVR